MIHSHNFSVIFYLHMNYDIVSKYKNIGRPFFKPGIEQAYIC